MTSQAFTVRVPGNTSNLGAGFDSFGLAVSRYLRVDITESKTLSFAFHSPALADIAEDEHNLVYVVAEATARKMGRRLPCFHMDMYSDIPLARGLGSSAAAIVAGITVADELLDLHLSADEKFRIALSHENHGDDISASLHGGLVVAGVRESGSYFVPAGVPAVDMVVIVPPTPLSTDEARAALPDMLPFQTAIKGSGIANMTLAAILQDNWALAGELMSEDVFHQPYRMRLVPDLGNKMETAVNAGAYGAALSGAGPTMIAFVPEGEAERIKAELTVRFSEDEVFTVSPDAYGVQCTIKTPSAM